MKLAQRLEARRLRSLGLSCKAIASALSIGKGTISVWVRDVPLSVAQHAALREACSANGQRAAARATGHARARRAVWEAEAADILVSLRNNPTFVFGLGVYAGEGNKAGTVAGVTNSDKSIICAMLAFFKVIGLARGQLRLRVNYYADLDPIAVRNHWLSATGITPSLYLAKNSACSKHKASKLRFGTAQLVVCKRSAELHHKIMWWLSAYYQDFKAAMSELE